MIVKDISLVAKDIWILGGRGVSNKANNVRPTFQPKGAEPFGFEFYVEEMPLSIEVHPVVGASKRVIALNIYGIKKDGSGTLLVTEVV